MSKTRLFQAVKALDLEGVKALLEADPALRQVKDERRRNALHLLCGLPANDKTRARSLKLAECLLGVGFDVNAPAFVAPSASPRADDPNTIARATLAPARYSRTLCRTSSGVSGGAPLMTSTSST